MLVDSVLGEAWAGVLGAVLLPADIVYEEDRRLLIHVARLVIWD